mmetsp:Transcript_18859/g.58541  ORF Transcript_18859/g.58541 Transcript_18859/m.58541 type:complete len:271 (-) Transcript_18859:1204-2016(-)
MLDEAVPVDPVPELERLVEFVPLRTGEPRPFEPEEGGHPNFGLLEECLPGAVVEPVRRPVERRVRGAVHEVLRRDVRGGRCAEHQAVHPVGILVAGLGHHGELVPQDVGAVRQQVLGQAGADLPLVRRHHEHAQRGDEAAGVLDVVQVAVQQRRAEWVGQAPLRVHDDAVEDARRDVRLQAVVRLPRVPSGPHLVHEHARGAVLEPCLRDVDGVLVAFGDDRVQDVNFEAAVKRGVALPFDGIVTVRDEARHRAAQRRRPHVLRPHARVE